MTSRKSMKRAFLGVGVLLISSILLASCRAYNSPASAPITKATSAPAPPASTTPTSNLPPPTLQDESWTKVVEAAKKEGQVNLYSFSFTGDRGKGIREAFKKQYGIEVNIVTGVGATLMERIRSEHAGGKDFADVFDSAAALLLSAKGQGLLQDWGALPFLSEKVNWVINPKVDPDGQILCFSMSFMGPFANTNLVKAGEEPKSFKEFLDPKWKGKILVGSPLTMPNINTLYIWGLREKVLDENFWRSLNKQDLKVGATVRDVEAMLGRGEAHVLLTTTESSIGTLISQGAPIKPLEMSEGTAVTFSLSASMVKWAPHPNAARLFAQWLFSKEGQDLFQKLAVGKSTRGDVPDYRPMPRLNPTKYSAPDLELMAQTDKSQREGILAKLLGIEQ